MTVLPDSWSCWLKARLALPLLVLNGWVLLQLLQYFDPLLTIFVLAAVLAFVLNYPVRFLQQRGIPRSYAVLLVLLVGLLLLAALGVTLIPALITQATEIATLFPDWLSAASQKLQWLEDWAVSHQLPINLSHALEQLPDRLPSEFQAIADQGWTLALDAVDSLTDVLLTGVLTFYLLLDGKRVWDGIFQRLPLRNSEQLRRSLQEDFHAYFAGQLILGLLMGVTLSLAFLILKVPYSLLLGLGIGIMTLIPFGDTVSFIVLGLILATQDVGLGIRTLIVGLVIDQTVDQAIAPRVLGGFTGLKPIWVLIALLLGTKIAGLAGLLTAVPLASFVKTVLVEPPLLAEPDTSNGTFGLKTTEDVPECLPEKEPISPV